MWEVVVMEFERGWGSKADSVENFDTKEEADVFVRDFNKDNTATVVPDWYMVALTPNYVGKK